ncbi:MAG: hypothetical protein KatS3mg055_1703 [Chloroflexus sp.]|uniref:hypothetical protein n=1 Tax=Chloroflexus sp. TaxID=1904827 RepID=UPI0021DBB7B6|nr:hypothetical protein [Chloroflexus sp.]GIV89185.1 MAG: hypothetical protein KatS3mg055_1703 [Chloroflexus sp.]
MRERNGGADPGPLVVAAADYVRLFGRRSLTSLTDWLLERVAWEAGGRIALREPIGDVV